MYYYVYDSPALAKDSVRVLTRVETEINNLGLSGERGQVSALRNTEDLVREATRRGYHPIVAVGNDATFNAALNAIAQNSGDKKPPLGYIPLEDDYHMAKLLGVDPTNAVVALSRRILRQVPLAQAGRAYFLSQVRCVLPDAPPERGGLLGRFMRRSKPTFEATITMDTVTASVTAEQISVHYDPRTARLRLEVQGPKQGKRGASRGEGQTDSIMWGKHITIEGKPQLACLIDGRPVTRTPLEVGVSQVRIPLIVGRSRQLE